jgi:hypothetical protein
LVTFGFEHHFLVENSLVCIFNPITLKVAEVDVAGLHLVRAWWPLLRVHGIKVVEVLFHEAAVIKPDHLVKLHEERVLHVLKVDFGELALYDSPPKIGNMELLERYGLDEEVVAGAKKVNK